MDNYFVVSYLANNLVISNLKKYGNVIVVYPHKHLATPVCCHADMQLTPIDSQTLVYAPYTNSDTLNILSKNGIRLIMGNSELSPLYPGNIVYNILKVGKNIYHNIKYTDYVVKKLFEEKNYNFVNIKQGYAGCSSVYVKDLLLTNDNGIKKTAEKDGVSCYHFDGNDIILKGYNRGFIGGSACYDSELGLLLTGRLELLNEGKNLAEVLNEKGVNVIELTDGIPEDIGGIQLYKL